MIEDLDSRRERDAVEDVFPRTKEELLEECKSPKKSWNDFHSKVWSACNFVFEEKKLHVWIKFRGGVYLPEKIESTKQSPWFPWLPQPKAINKVKAAVKPLPKKKENK
jgi:hypothetical protein